MDEVLMTLWLLVRNLLVLRLVQSGINVFFQGYSVHLTVP